MQSAERHFLPIRSKKILGFARPVLMLCGLLWMMRGSLEAQTDPAALKSRLDAATNDTQRVDVLNQFSEAWRERNTDSAFAYARQAYDLARKIDYQRGTGEARLNQAHAFLTSGRPADAKATVAKARVDFEQRNDASGLGKCALAEATILFSESAHYDALLTCLDADSLFLAAADTAGRIRSRFLMADIFASQLAYAPALRQLDAATELATDEESEVRTLLRKAKIQAASSQNEAGIANYTAAISLLRRNNFYSEEAEALNQLAPLQVQAGDTAAALNSLQKAMALSKKHNLGSARAHALGQLALLASPVDSARKLMQEALRTLPDTSSAPARARFHLDMARVWLRWPDYDQALARSDSAMKWLDSVPNLALEAEVEQLRYAVYERVGNAGRAMKSLARTNELRDGLRESRMALEKKGEELEKRYGDLMEARSQAKALLDHEREWQAKANEREMYILIGAAVLGFMALLFFLMWMGSRRKGRAGKRVVKRLEEELAQADEELLVLEQKLNDARDELYNRGKESVAPDPEKVEQLVASRTRELNETVERLRDLNRELDTFMYRASHDLLGPIARLKGLVLVARSTGEDLESIQTYIQLIDAVSVYLDRVLRKLIIVHELQHATRQIGPINVGHVIEDITPRLSELPGISQPFILLHDELEAKVQADANLLTIVLENLLENACVFRADPANSRPRIDVWVRRKGRDIEIELRDEGIGIPDEVREKVFDIFFRGSERSKGNGLGLYLVKMAVDLLGGRIELESEEGVFTHVKVRFPEAG